MASDQLTSTIPAEPPTSTVPAPPPQPLQAWLARLGLSGKLLAIGGLVGVIAVFLPLFSMSIEMPSLGGVNVLGGKAGVNLPTVGMNQSVLVVRDFRGMLCLVCYLAALALTIVLYQPNGPRHRALGWAGLSAGALLTLLSLWLLVSAFGGGSSLGGFFGASFKVSVGFGAILNLLAAATVAAGGFLKVREEKLI
jgi:hypothetical protein